MKRQHNQARSAGAAKVACTVSAAALMLGVSQAATVGLRFGVNYCGDQRYTSKPLAMTAFGIPANQWETLTNIDTGYGCPGVYVTLNQVVDTTTSTGGLNPLPNGSLNLTWSANMGNFSGFGGYAVNTPSHGYGGAPLVPVPTGEYEIYKGFLRDGINFGPPGGNNNSQAGYVVDVMGLKSLFTNTPFAIQLVASSDSMQYLTNAFIIDATGNTTQSVVYPSTPPVSDVNDAPWIRGHGGGLSTASGSLNTDHVKIIGDYPEHGGDKVTGSNYASTITGFIVTDKPVISMSPQPVLVCPGDTVVWSGYAVGVPPLSYQWRKNGVAISGATGTSFGLTNVSLADNGTYDLLVTNLYGSAVSAAVSVDHLSITEGNNYVVDSNPSNPPVDGLDFGATWLASSGAQSGVMSFNATNGNQIVVPPQTNFDSSVGAIMFWMRSSGPTNSTGSPAMLFDRHLQGSSGLVIAQDTNGTLQVNTKTTADHYSSTSTALSDGNWHHVAVVFDTSFPSGRVTLYVDGQYDNGIGNSVAWSWPAGRQLEFGLSHDTGSWQAYNGLMDDIRFYNRVLSDAEVLSIFQSGTTLDNTALLLRLNFDTAPVAGVTLTWQCTDGVLQSSGIAGSGYTDIPSAASPYSTALRAAMKFFRYKRSQAPATLIANPYLM